MQIFFVQKPLKIPAYENYFWIINIGKDIFACSAVQHIPDIAVHEYTSLYGKTKKQCTWHCFPISVFPYTAALLRARADFFLAAVFL